MSYFIGSRTIKIFPKWRLLSGSQQQVVTLRLLRHYVSLEYRHLTNCIDKSLVGPICCSMDHLGKKVEMVSLGSPLMIIIFSMLPQNFLTKVLFTSRCRLQNICPSLLRLVDGPYTVIHKTQKTRMKVLPSATTGE